MKLNFQTPAAIVFSVVFLSLTFLVWAGKVPHEVLGTLIAWLVPSPISVQDKALTGGGQ